MIQQESRTQTRRQAFRPAGLRGAACLPFALGLNRPVDAPRLSFDAYNISNGVRTTVGEILEAFREHFPGLRYRVMSDGSVADPARRVRVERGPLDSTRLFTDCGYRPTFDLESGLAEYVRWWRNTSGES